ncbi:MAG: TatD family hydrolase [archaeon]|nr:TatD family hydrolase [archaeon]
MLVDAHCHLNEFSSPKQIVENALKHKVTQIITCSENIESMHKNLELAKSFPSVKACFGIHPNQAGKTTQKQLDEAVEFIRKNIDFCYAIGEIGLDFSHNENAEEKKWQETIFEKFIDIALEFDKAIVVHSRNSEKEVFEILEKKDVGKALLHWFYCDDELLEKVIVAKYFISLGPSVFSQKKFQEFCKKIPKNLLLLETDAPVEFNGEKSSPEWIPKILEKVAELKNEKPFDLAVEFERNEQILFL